MSISGVILAIPSLRSCGLAALLTSVVLVLTAGVAFAASSRSQPGTPPHRQAHHQVCTHSSLTTHELRLVDSTGTTRMILSARTGNPALTMLDLHGRVLLSASLDAQGFGSVRLTNPIAGLPQATLALDDKGAHVKFDREGGASSYLFLNNQGESGAVFLDVQGKRRLNLLVMPDGKSVLERFDDQGEQHP